MAVWVAPGLGAVGGGKFDGVMGVVIALEVFRCAPEAPLELVIFAEEEGTTFGLGMLGSRSWAGEISVAELDKLKNRHGESYLEAGRPHGVSADCMRDDLLDPSAYRGMIEVHAEQGLGLWSDGLPVGVVTRINGRREFALRFGGQGNHAGSTRMGQRRDALAGSAEAVLAVEALGRRLDAEREHSVMTVGCIGVRPNAVNVIPGVAELRVDFRAQDERVLADGEERLRAELSEIARKRTLELSITKNEQVPPSPLDADLRMRLVEAAAALGYTMPERPSGALHDAARLAGHMPAGMLFVASRDGISHDPREFSRSEDIALAAEIVLETIRR